jgi:hypothetical protein
VNTNTNYIRGKGRSKANPKRERSATNESPGAVLSYSQRNNSANRSFSLSDARQKKRLRKVKGKDRQLDSDDEDIEEGQAPLPPSSIEV